MNAEHLAKRVEESFERRSNLLSSKGADYGKDADVLSVFKESVVILNILRVEGRTDHTAVGVAQTMLAVKMVRDANLRESGKHPSNESRRDTQDDAHNYMDLCAALEADEAHMMTKADSKLHDNAMSPPAQGERTTGA